MLNFWDITIKFGKCGDFGEFRTKIYKFTDYVLTGHPVYYKKNKPAYDRIYSKKIIIRICEPNIFKSYLQTE